MPHYRLRRIEGLPFKSYPPSPLLPMLKKKKEVRLLYSNYSGTMPRVPVGFAQESQMSSYGSTSEATTVHGTDPCSESRRLWLNALPTGRYALLLGHHLGPICPSYRRRGHTYSRQRDCVHYKNLPLQTHRPRCQEK